MVRHTPPTVSVRALLPVFSAAAGRKTPLEWAELGFEPSVASQPDARVAASLLLDALALAEVRTGDPHLGLHIGERSDPRRDDVFGFLLRHSVNVRQALTRLTRYLRLLNDAFVWTLEEDATSARMALEIRGLHVDHDTPGLRGLLELSLATGLRAIRDYSEAPVVLEQLQLAVSPPASPGELTRFFGVTPRWRVEKTQVSFSARTLELPFRTADPQLGGVLERYAEDLLAALPSSTETWADRVRAQLLKASDDRGGPSLAEVARTLALSPRSLQRRLGEECTTFAALADETLRIRSEKYLRNPQLPLAEIAWILGFNDQSAFHRAFRRWTGKTPVEYRRDANGGASGT
ncbi:MAG: AraC family transcriptional regulator ligand-binding domain-containing protein [Myxococcaceae bacterium]